MLEYSSIYLIIIKLAHDLRILNEQFRENLLMLQDFKHFIINTAVQALYYPLIVIIYILFTTFCGGA